MSKKVSKMLAAIMMAATLALTAGCVQEVPDVQPEATADAVTAASAEEYEVTDLEWSAQPQLGIIKGDYYRAKSFLDKVI